MKSTLLNLCLSLGLAATASAGALAPISTTPSPPAPTGDPKDLVCEDGFNYCGHHLESLGNYRAQIDQALGQAGQPNDTNHEKNSLFTCVDALGDILFLDFCAKGCKDHFGRNDSCAN